MITIYHLAVSQSDRIVWLMEELGLPYKLQWYERGEDLLAPPEYRALHPAGTAPIIRDGDLVMAESTAICEYISQRYGGGKLSVQSDDPNYPHYLYWMQFNNNAQSAFFVRLAIQMAGGEETDNMVLTTARRREEGLYHQLDARVAEVEYLAGSQFSCADIMSLFNLTSLAQFGGRTIDDLQNAQAYVDRITARPAYQKAMAIAGPAAVRPDG